MLGLFSEEFYILIIIKLSVGHKNHPKPHSSMIIQYFEFPPIFCCELILLLYV